MDALVPASHRPPMGSTSNARTGRIRRRCPRDLRHQPRLFGGRPRASRPGRIRLPYFPRQVQLRAIKPEAATSSSRTRWPPGWRAGTIPPGLPTRRDLALARRPAHHDGHDRHASRAARLRHRDPAPAIHPPRHADYRGAVLQKRQASCDRKAHLRSPDEYPCSRIPEGPAKQVVRRWRALDASNVTW